MVKIAPSILSADFARLGQEVAQICKDGADYVHVDIMDGHFVPNFSFGPMVVKAIKPYSTLPFDVHLMMDNPNDFIDNFILAGANRVIFHAQTVDNVGELLRYIRSQGAKAGLCLNPKTPVKSLEPYLDDLDVILIMTVEPGFGGQTFMEDKLPKIAEAKQLIGSRDIEIEVDGGINEVTAEAARHAGADSLVAGNYIFKSADRKAAIQKLRGTEQ